MTTTNDTETAAHSPELNPIGTDDSTPSQVMDPAEPTYLDRMAGLSLAHQARAQMDLAADRCLLRRNLKATQNERYGLGQDNLPECEEDDMGVHVGDDNSKTEKSVTHNHYYGECHDHPHPHPPHPHPPARRWPWWLIMALILPWIALAIMLVGWILANYEQDPVLWRLDIEAENPVVEPEPPTVQPAGE